MRRSSLQTYLEVTGVLFEVWWFIPVSRNHLTGVKPKLEFIIYFIQETSISDTVQEQVAM